MAECVTAEPERLKCPSCGEVLPMGLVAKAKEGSTITLQVTMEDGCMLEAHALGKVILDMGKLLDATAKDVGANLVHFVESLKSEGNTLSVTFVSATARKGRQNGGKGRG